MSATSTLSSRLQDYLEAILDVADKNGVSRVRDIARRLHVRSSTVTGSLKKLAEEGLVNYNPYEVITLTPSGAKAARDVARTHRQIRRFLVEVLGLPPGKADENACRMEHAIDKQALDRLMKFIDFVENCPRGGSAWTRQFDLYCRHGFDLEKCVDCIRSCRREMSKVLTRIRRKQETAEKEQTGADAEKT